MEVQFYSLTHSNIELKVISHNHYSTEGNMFVLQFNSHFEGRQ